MNDYFQNKTIKYLIFLMIIVVLFVLLKEVFLKKERLEIPEPALSFPEIEVDLNLLKSQEIKELLPFEELTLPENIGRENPFNPY